MTRYLQVDVAIDRKITGNENFISNPLLLTKGLRATLLYRQLAESTNNKLALRIINEVFYENNVHVNESLKLLHDLAEDEEKLVAQKAREEEEMKNIRNRFLEDPFFT